MTKKILIILITLAVMFTVSAYKKQTHKVEQLNSTITTIEQQKQSTETELHKTKETDSQNQQKIKELEEKIRQLEADLQAREARKKYLASLSQPERWMLEAGIPEDQWQVAYELVRRESTWNPNAVNPSSGACGLAQSLPCGKQAKYGAWDDPVANLKWQYEYVNGRYGGYAQAIAFHDSNNWY
jgi:vacuolar-type H+-ATPase subunit I/STV1